MAALSSSSPPAGGRALDARAIARLLARWAAADAAPWLHWEVARRMGQRLPVILTRPRSIVEWWGHAGASDAVLRAAYPQARRLRVEPTEALAQRSARAVAAPWWSARRWGSAAPSVCREGEVQNASVQLVWSNMALQTVADPPALIERWRQVLQVDGFVMLSTLGPDTLLELRALYRDAGWGSPGAAFVDMHDFGDMLVHAGFADPVMDQERVDLSWATPEALLAELRILGCNADPLRRAGLRTPRWRGRLLDALRARQGPDGRISMRFEIAYGHAFNPPPRARLAAQTRVPLEDLRRMAHEPRRKR